MKSTILDVAKHAGVSIKTVSRVTNNEATVRQSTREKVLASIAELNYQPNLAARNLATTKSYNIAFIYDNPNAYYIIDMQNGILAECQKRGYELLIHPCDSQKENMIDEFLLMIKRSQIAGIVITPPFSEMPLFIDKLADAQIPFVRIISGNGLADNISPCIMINDQQAAFNITEYLIKLGHRDIAFLSGSAEHLSTAERLKGYKLALESHDIEINADLILAGDYSFESGVKGANTLIAQNKKVSAIFACNDEIAAGALFAARLSHIDVPSELSIIGFENSPFSRQTWPKLTTAAQPNQEIAQRATAMFIDSIKSPTAQYQSELYVPQLVERESTTKASK